MIQLFIIKLRLLIPKSMIYVLLYFGNQTILSYYMLEFILFNIHFIFEFIIIALEKKKSKIK